MSRVSSRCCLWSSPTGTRPACARVWHVTLSHWRGAANERTRLVEKNVRRHQHGVVKQPDADVLALLARFLLVLYHALEPVDGRRAIEQPRELGVRGDVTLRAWVTWMRARGAEARADGLMTARSTAANLDEYAALRRIDARRQVDRSGLNRLLRQSLAIVRRSDGVQIDHAEQRVVLVLVLHPLPDRSEVIAEMERASRLHARENALTPSCSGALLCGGRCRAVRRRDARQQAAARRAPRAAARGSEKGLAHREHDKRQQAHRGAGIHEVLGRVGST